MSELKTAVEVAQALERGEVVEHQYIGDSGKWRNTKSGGWSWCPDQIIYRIKPKPLECWVNVYGDNLFSAYRSKEGAEKCVSGTASRVAVHMREVTE
jgi:hypothetical protein